MLSLYAKQPIKLNTNPGTTLGTALDEAAKLSKELASEIHLNFNDKIHVFKNGKAVDK
jgi:hypothetical protein